MQIIKGIAIAAVLIIAGLLALIVAAVRRLELRRLFLNSRRAEKNNGSRKDRKHDRKN